MILLTIDFHNEFKCIRVPQLFLSHRKFRFLNILMGLHRLGLCLADHTVKFLSISALTRLGLLFTRSGSKP
jgi:hypothetical protein